MIAHPIGYPTHNPMTHPNRGRIPRIDPSRPDPFTSKTKCLPHRRAHAFGDWTWR